MKKIMLILSEVEADSLIKLLDTTLKSTGYAGKDAVYFIDKIISEFNKVKGAESKEEISNVIDKS